MKSMKPGGGGRFEKLKGELASRPGVTNPGGLAAYIGRKKYGASKMEEFSEKGRKRSGMAGKLDDNEETESVHKKMHRK